MPEFEELLIAAYKSEMVLSRRLQKKLGLSPCDALVQVLQHAAGTHTLDELLRQRRQLKQDAVTRRDTHRREKAQAYAAKKLLAQPDAAAWQAWFDGSTHPNPGRMGVGGILKSPDGAVVRISRAAGQGNSSKGEYLALIAVLQEAVRLQPKKLQIYGDSQVVINDVMQQGGKTASGLESHRAQARQLMAQLNLLSLTWVPRHKNAEADALSQQAIKLPA
ncbi:ribonuclease HI family protein [Undibacterium terreum]|uniref:RNase H type-1 domain-containing protein n=1 Tax=Undibacterium terreum TaxID=1224302 RepID=A0A916UDV7_9BURK|nr:ribonuclease HI family protein [Undibacterium terreum]GGC68649.1 hypothetical protein GCM10011396_14610 [Undibacterium terreum]